MDAKAEWAPARIYLQREQGECGSHTWCEDSVGDGDLIEEVAYVRADVAALPSDAAQAPQGWIACADRLPKESDHRRVLIYTDGYDFAGEQFFDVEADSLNECSYSDPEDQPEECRVASHWMPHPYPRAAPVAPAAAAHPDKREAFEAWAKHRGYDLTRCSPVAYAAYKSDLTNGALAGWLGALESLPTLSTETVDKPVQRMSDAERDVLAERARQVSVEGWTPTHDDQNSPREMPCAAAAYALSAAGRRGDGVEVWPSTWAYEWWKPTTPRRDLVKAGALIIAEIERIDRAGESDV